MSLWGHSAVSFRTCRGEYNMLQKKLVYALSDFLYVQKWLTEEEGNNNQGMENKINFKN